MTNERAYTCPMHPEVSQKLPGMCPECGMNLVIAAEKSAQPHIAHGAHEHSAREGGAESRRDKHAGHSTAAFLRKFWINAALSVPVILYSSVPQALFGWSPPAFPGSAYVPFMLGSVVFFYGGWVFIAGARREIIGRAPGMMTLIAVAVSTAYLWSVYAEFFGKPPLWWELTTLIVIMLLGHWIEMRAVSGAQGALKELSKLLPDTADVVRGEKTERVPLSELREGDAVLVKPGGKVPADGVVLEGESDVNESMITGESQAVLKKAGASVIAGTVNGDGALTVSVTHIGEGTFLAGVMRLVAEAQASKSRLQILADRAAFFLTVVALGGGAFTFVAWAALGAGIAVTVSRAVAVLVIACPHALGLAVPLVASISTTKAAKNGFLVRQRLALEAARNVDTVMFDKTGTLTRGAPAVVSISAADGVSEERVLALAASLDASSEHPAAKAIVEAARSRGVKTEPASGHAALPGRGARAEIGGKEILVGGQALLDERALALPPELARAAEAARAEGRTLVFVLEERVLGMLALADAVREESKEAVRALKALGIRSSMVTGDSEEAARAVAREVGLDEYFARVLPEEKSQKVKELRARGRVVAMVGDGVNDAPALAEADVGIAVGAGTNVAIESAGIILVRNDPRDVAKVIHLSKLTYRKMVENLWWGAGYNIVAIPLAAGILAPWGFFLEPAFAAVLMSASTVIVSVNAALLARARL